MTTIRLDDEILKALQTLKERDGVPIAEQVRRALLAYLETKGVRLGAERKRAVTRKRP